MRRLTLRIATISLGLLTLLAAPRNFAQCPRPADADNILPPPPSTVPDSSTLQGEPLVPESGVLSDRVYTSRFFGFSIDLPIALSGHRMLLAPLPSGQYALLAEGFQQGSRSGTFVITAGSHMQVGRKETPEEKQEDYQRWAQGKPPQVSLEPPDWMQRSGQMKHAQKHVRDLYGAQYWTRIKNYTVRFTVESNDSQFLKRSKQVVHDIRFYCPEDDGTLIEANGNVLKLEGEPYLGPSVPTDSVDKAIEEKHAEKNIPLGAVEDGMYRNAELGLRFEIPTGWKSVNVEGLDDPKPPRIYDLLQACSRTLLRLQRPLEHPRDRSEALVLRAIDQGCLSLPMPVNEQDVLRAESLGEYLSVLGILGSVTSRRLQSLSGRLFAGYGGTLPDQDPSAKKINGILQRDITAAAVTRYRKLLLIWVWSAPSSDQEQLIPCTTVTFGEANPVRLCPQFASLSVASKQQP